MWLHRHRWKELRFHVVPNMIWIIRTSSLTYWTITLISNRFNPCVASTNYFTTPLKSSAAGVDAPSLSNANTEVLTPTSARSNKYARRTYVCPYDEDILFPMLFIDFLSVCIGSKNCCLMTNFVFECSKTKYRRSSNQIECGGFPFKSLWTICSLFYLLDVTNSFSFNNWTPEGSTTWYWHRPTVEFHLFPTDYTRNCDPIGCGP